MSQQSETGLGRRFYVYVAGKTNGAHQDIIEKLRSAGQVEVYSDADCDYLLLICPVVSRVLTDITEALSQVQSNKPVILVVMHHTFNPDYVLAENRRQTQLPNVHLTVDYLFYQQRLLSCNRNDISWHEIRTFLRLHFSQKSWLQTLIERVRKHLLVVSLVSLFVVVAIVTTIFITNAYL